MKIKFHGWGGQEIPVGTGSKGGTGGTSGTGGTDHMGGTVVRVVWVDGVYC